MKKLIVGLLMTAMICSLAACGGKNQSSAGTDTSAVGETAENADSSASSEDVVAYQAGTWDGVTYTNTSLGMCLTLPDGWQIGTQEQIDAVVDSHVQGLVDDSLRGIVLCYLKENKAVEEMYAQQDGGEQKLSLIHI